MNKQQAIMIVEGLPRMDIKLTRQSFISIGVFFSGRYNLTEKEKERVINALKQTSPRFKAGKFREYLD